MSFVEYYYVSLIYAIGLKFCSVAGAVVETNPAYSLVESLLEEGTV